MKRLRLFHPTERIWFNVLESEDGTRLELWTDKSPNRMIVTRSAT